MTSLTKVKKPNQTIGLTVVNGTKLTAMSRKLYSAILLSSQKQGNLAEYQAELNQLMAIAGIEHKNQVDVKKNFVDLMSPVISYNKKHEDDLVWGELSHLVSHASISPFIKGKKTIVKWVLPDDIRAILINPTSFWTLISLQMVTKLRSGASISLYEIACQYATNNHKDGITGFTPKLKPDDWMAKILGESNNKSYEYRFFRRDILLPAIEEINSFEDGKKLTDITIALRETKKSNRVETVHFEIIKEEAFYASDIVIDETLSQRIQNTAGISKLRSQAILKKYSQDEIVRQLNLLDEKQKSGPVGSPAAWLTKGLKEGWTKARPKPTIPEDKAPIEKEVKPEQDDRELRRVLMLSDFNSLDDAEQQSLIEAFLAQAGSYTIKQFKKNRFESKLVKLDFVKFLESY